MINCIVVDFANTLSFTPYFWPLGPAFLAIVTEAIFTRENKAQWAGPWCRGELSSEDIAKHLSGLSGLPAKLIIEALHAGCSDLQMNPAIWRFAQALRAQGRYSVLATVNMDVFTQIVVPAHGFDKVFDVVVNSSDFGTEDKNALCEIAFDRLDGCTFQHSLMIDDSTRVIEAFLERGGMAYQYTCDAAFEEWAKTLDFGYAALP